MTNTDVWKDH